MWKQWENEIKEKNINKEQSKDRRTGEKKKKKKKKEKKENTYV